MSTILVDRIGSVALHNGIIRVNCIANGGKPDEHSTGTLLIPVSRMAAIMKSLLDAAKELDQKAREQQTKAAAEAEAALQATKQ